MEAYGATLSRIDEIIANLKTIRKSKLQIQTHSQPLRLKFPAPKHHQQQNDEVEAQFSDKYSVYSKPKSPETLKNTKSQTRVQFPQHIFPVPFKVRPDYQLTCKQERSRSLEVRIRTKQNPTPHYSISCKIQKLLDIKINPVRNPSKRLGSRKHKTIPSAQYKQPQNLKRSSGRIKTTAEGLAIVRYEGSKMEQDSVQRDRKREIKKIEQRLSYCRRSQRKSMTDVIKKKFHFGHKGQLGHTGRGEEFAGSVVGWETSDD